MCVDDRVGGQQTAVLSLGCNLLDGVAKASIIDASREFGARVNHAASGSSKEVNIVQDTSTSIMVAG